MFSETIGNLKQRGLIADDDIAFFCMDKPSASAGVMFGAIGAAIAMSKCDHYVMSIGKDKVTLFDIDKKTGSYLDTMSMIRKSDIALLRVNGLLGGKIITIKSSEGNFAYNASNKYKKQKQKEQLKRLKDFVAENYPKQ